jgi:phage-related minor tail protein
MANKRIKGITIEIGADSTGLDKALKGVEGGANKAKEELREVDRALKNAPESAVLWAQKQELLTKALEESRKKVDLLRDAQDQVNRQFQEGKISEEQYRAFQREVEKAEADVQRLTGELEKSKDGMKKMSENSDDAAEALEKTGESAEETGGKLDKISGIAVAAGAALAGAAKGAYESWEEVDEGYDTIIQKTGVTGENLKEFQSIADEVFTNLPVEMSDVGTAIGEVNTRFQVTDDLLKTISEDFLIYAQLNGRDVNSSIDNVSASMKAFDIEAEQAGKVLDTLTAVGQSTGVDLAQLESVLLANSATFKEMDLSIGESIQLLGQFEINGVDTATALAGLKKAQQNATAEGKTMSEALNDNISKIKNAKTETEALQIATDLFGKKGAAAMAQAISEGRFELETLTADMNAFSGITKTTFEATLDAPDKLKVTLNNLKLEGAELAEKVLPKIEKGADYLVKNLPKIENTLEKSMPLVKGIAAGFVYSGCVSEEPIIFEKRYDKRVDIIFSEKGVGIVGGKKKV